MSKTTWYIGGGIVGAIILLYLFSNSKPTTVGPNIAQANQFGNGLNGLMSGFGNMVATIRGTPNQTVAKSNMSNPQASYSDSKMFTASASATVPAIDSTSDYVSGDYTLKSKFLD